MAFLAPILPYVAGAAIGGGTAYLQKRAADKAAGTALEASRVEAGAQTEALDYLKDIDKLPQDLKQQALARLGGLYGLEGGIGSQEDLIRQAIQSPLYKNIMSGLDLGEEAILRNAGATGGLRSGNVSYNLADFATRLQNYALLQSYNEQLQGLTGLSGLNTNEDMIARIISGIGETEASGITAAGQAKQQGLQGILDYINQLTSVGFGSGLFSSTGSKGLTGLQKSLGGESGETGNIVDNLPRSGGVPIYPGMFCDRRLKKNIKILGQIKGYNWCSFEWNSIANKLGLTGKTCGIMADEVFEKVPEAVILKDGFMFVLYQLLMPELYR